MQIDPSAVKSFGGGGRVCIMARVYPIAVVESGAHMCAFNNGSTTIRARKHGKKAAHFLDL